MALCKIGASVSGWICLDDPENNEVPAFNPAPKPIRWSPDGEHDWSADTIAWPPIDLPEFAPNAPHYPTPDVSVTLSPVKIIVTVSVFVVFAVMIWMVYESRKQ